MNFCISTHRLNLKEKQQDLIYLDILPSEELVGAYEIVSIPPWCNSIVRSLYIGKYVNWHELVPGEKFLIYDPKTHDPETQSITGFECRWELDNIEAVILKPKP